VGELLDCCFEFDGVSKVRCAPLLRGGAPLRRGGDLPLSLTLTCGEWFEFCGVVAAICHTLI
jgi:hypothetical protein